MLATTALAILTATASISPTAQTVSPTVQSVSPTATQTYTVKEVEIYSRGWRDGVKNYNCIMLCNLLQEAIDGEKEIKKALIKIDPKIDPYNSGPADASYYKREAAETRRSIKEKKCDCAKYKDK